MHAPLHPLATVDAAVARTVGHKPASPWVIQLTPAKMQFHLAASPDVAPAARPSDGFDTSLFGWQETEVPCSWQMDPAVTENAQYTNVRYPLPGLDSAEALREFPVPRTDNPVGSFQTTFELPRTWNGRRILLQLDGAEPNVACWVNGIEVGYGQDSRLPSEFDVTLACTTRAVGHDGTPHDDVSGRHVLSIQIVRWCDGSYLECQDAWHLSGLHRHVWLYSKPAELAIADYALTTLETQHDGATARLEVRCDGGNVRGRAMQLRRDAIVVASLHGPHVFQPGEMADAAPGAAAASAESVPGRRVAISEVWRSESAVADMPRVEVPEPVIAEHGIELDAAGALLVGAYGCEMSVHVPRAQMWTAETPHLYLLVLELRSTDGVLLDCESSWVGFRTVAILDGLVCVNGRPITIRGVNRHDHCPKRGKAVDWPTMLHDARLIKSHSLNSVRTSHYPNDSRWLELCDAIGLYVVDEANLETCVHRNPRPRACPLSWM